MGTCAGPSTTVASGLIIKFDPANIKSYPGSGLSMTDISNNGNNASLVSGVVYDPSNAGCLQTSAGKYIYVPPNASINSTGIHSFSVWFYATGIYSGNNGFIGKGPDDNTEQYCLLTNNSFSIVYSDVGTNTGPYLQINQSVSTGVWHNLTYTCSAGSGSSKLQMYYDGVLLNGTTSNPNQPMNSDTGNPLVIGASRVGGNNHYFLGKIGAFDMYNRDITASEVSTNFASQRARYGR